MERKKLPDTRQGFTHKFRVGEHKGYLTVGLYEDGSPGEIFITISKEGSTIGGLMDSIATMTSIALQYGVPLESLVKKFSHQRFEPAGHTPNPDIPYANSIVDYIFRYLGIKFGASSPVKSNPEEVPVGIDLPVVGATPPDVPWADQPAASGEDDIWKDIPF